MTTKTSLRSSLATSKKDDDSSSAPVPRSLHSVSRFANNKTRGFTSLITQRLKAPPRMLALAVRPLCSLQSQALSAAGPHSTINIKTIQLMKNHWPHCLRRVDFRSVLRSYFVRLASLISSHAVRHLIIGCSVASLARRNHFRRGVPLCPRFVRRF